MGLKYRIIKGKKLVQAVGWEIITLSELMEHVDQLARDPGYDPPMKKLVDYRNVKSICLTMTEADIFAHKKAEYSQRFFGERCAIVAPSSFNFGMARVHEIRMEQMKVDIETMVFRDLRKAVEWLDVELTEDEIKWSE